MMKLAIPLLMLILLQAQAKNNHCDNGDCPTNMYCHHQSGSRECHPCSQREEACHTKDQPRSCGRYCARLLTKQLREGLACEKIPPLENGYINSTNLVNELYRYKDKFTIHCEKGYHGTGETSNTCGEYGHWEHQFAACSEDECPIPPDIDNGLTYIPYGRKSLKLGMNVSYTCNEFFVLEGSDVITCGVNGIWNSKPPECKEKTCTLPRQIPNGNHNGSRDLLPGDNLKFECDRTYYPVGSQSLTCLPSGTFNQEFPSCEAVKCHDPPAVINGHFKGSESSYSVGAMIIYECMNGSEMQGKEHRIWTCLANRTWTRNTVPMCLEVRKPEIKCLEPRHILHGLHDATTDSDPGGTIEFKCEDDYELIGDKVITCLVDGRWDSDPPKCHRMMCQPPHKLANGDIIENDLAEFYLQRKVHYVCDKGFTMNDTQNSIWTCVNEANHTIWDKRAMPVCLKLPAEEGCSCAIILILSVILAVIVLLVCWRLVLKDMVTRLRQFMFQQPVKKRNQDVPLIRETNTEHVAGNKIDIKTVSNLHLVPPTDN